jgi:8-amino-7-oxononanoate synthase
MINSHILNCYSTYRQHRQIANTFRELNLRAENVLDFSSNDYLGLSKHPDLIRIAQETAQQYGVGATGSRLLSGNSQMLLSFEDQVAHHKQTECALILNTGYQANISVLSALLDPTVLKHQALVFFDKANHNSLYQAAFLSGAQLIRYSHGNMEKLSTLLDSFEGDPRPKFIVSETLFGMDGDFAPLDKLVDLSHRHGAFLYLDEAHATGVTGPQGYGLSTTQNMSHIPHLIMGTFSKGLGCFGAYVACSQLVKDYLVNHCAGFIYSTALPPAAVGVAAGAWGMLPTLKEERTNLSARARNLRDQLPTLGFDIGLSQSHIVGIILKDERQTLAAQRKLLMENILVSAVRPPTIPPKTSRLRIALTTRHTDEDIATLLKGLESL